MVKGGAGSQQFFDELGLRDAADIDHFFREAALNCARADTHTPVSYWYEMPVVELFGWMESILKIEKSRPKKK